MRIIRPRLTYQKYSFDMLVVECSIQAVVAGARFHVDGDISATNPNYFIPHCDM